jgi:two-component system cell cycle response regulator DivK
MPITILYIEDNPDNMTLAEKALRPLGYLFLGAETGQAGLDLAAGHSPDVILLDITLPDMDGYEVARRLRSNPATSSVPILALTAHTLIGDGEKVVAAGCNAYLTKPISIVELRARVQSFISEPSGK